MSLYINGVLLATIIPIYNARARVKGGKSFSISKTFFEFIIIFGTHFYFIYICRLLFDQLQGVPTMFAFLILILPSSACFFCILQNVLFARRTSTFIIFQILLTVAGTFFLADTLYAAPAINQRALGIANLVKLASAPCLIPLAWMYLHKLNTNTRFLSWQFLWLAIPVFLLSTGILLHELAGSSEIAVFLDDFYHNGYLAVSKHKGDAVYMYYVFTVVVYKAILAIEALGALGYLIRYLIKERMSPKDILRFAKEGGACSPVELQLYNFIFPIMIVIAKVLLYNNILTAHIWLGPAIAILITSCILNLSFTSLFGTMKRLSLANMNYAFLYNHNVNDKSIVLDQALNSILDQENDKGLELLQKKVEERIPMKTSAKTEGTNSSASAVQLFATMAGTWDEENLLARFQKIVVKDKLFLQPGLSIIEIAKKLHTNKTYVSKLVNKTYNMGFPELLNTLRIDYAEQYILNHKDAKQNEIAEACGFLSASSFNNIFKKVKGMPPRMWIASINEKDHKTTQ